MRTTCGDEGGTGNSARGCLRRVENRDIYDHNHNHNRAFLPAPGFPVEAADVCLLKYFN